MMDYRDLMLEAAADVQALMTDFQKEMAMPKAKSQFAELWMQLPDETKEKFKKDKPREYQALMNGLKGEE